MTGSQNYAPLGGIGRSVFVKLFFLGLGLLVWQPAPVGGQVMLSEFLAVNSGGLADENGDSSDWIELYNAGPFAVDLLGWHLTDDSNNLAKWTFPQVSLPSGAYLVVFASDKNRAPTPGQLHTNFKLTSSGEYLALVQSNGTTIEWEYAPAFPVQSQNVSYGINLSSQLEEYYPTPTPGTPNGAGLVDVLGLVTVSPKRGFYDAAFQVTLATTNPAVTIRYTLDGSAPTAASGTIYSSPIPITNTAVLRVLGYQSGYQSQPVVTHTYIFHSNVLNQSSTPPGYPFMWGSVTSVYGMYPVYPDSDATLRAGLLALPTVCVSGKIDDMFGPVNGFYFHGSKGNNDSWEKPGSIELIYPDGNEGFQVNAGVLGRADNVGAARKRGLRVEFKSIYGPTKLKFPGLFDGAKEGRESASDEFDALILRPGKAENYTAVSYNPHLNIYFRDIMVRDAQIAISGYGDRNIFVHLYLNGMYWGVYDLTEVYNQDYFADYFGGEPEDWFDVSTKDGSRRDGAAGLYDKTDVVATNRYLSFLSSMDTADLSQYTNYLRAAQDIKPKDFAEYIIYNSYYGVGDWPDNNWNFGMKNGPNPEPGFFLVWDAEKTWFENNDPQSYKHARYSPYLQSLNNPEGADYHPVINRVWEGLIKNAEFRMLFADRSYELMHNGGLLTDSNRISRLMYYVDLLNLPIRIDQKRWGADDRRGTLPGFMFTYTNVQAEINKVLANTVDNVSKYIAAFRAKQLYPSIDPPLIAVTGSNDTATTCTLTGGSGDRVYYTINGTDPRLLGAGVSPDAQTYLIVGGDTTLINFGASSWNYYVTSNGLGDSSIVVGHGSYNTGNWKHPDYLSTPVAGTADNQWHQGTAPLGYGSVGASGNLTTFGTTIGYGPNTTNRYPTTYFRREFNVTNASSYASLRLDAIFEDGGIIYLNGREIARSSAPFNTGNMSYGTFSLRDQSGAAENTVETHTRILAPGDLVEGRNVISVETHNFTANNSDLAMELKVTGLRPPNPGVNVQLTDSSVLKARSWQAGEWSALNKLAVSRPSLRQIIFSEIMYNPPMFGIVDGDAFEFVELKNVGAAPVNLRGMTFTLGLTFTFNTDLVLAPGAVAVLVADAAQFAIKYPGVPIAGTYAGNLANDGETLELQDMAGVVVARASYNDKSPWPESADNGGYSLIPISTAAAFDGSDPTLWRASRNVGGSPGTDDPSPVSDVLISEILAHTDPPQKDSLELRNVSSQPVNVSGWSLTDDATVPAKFIIPPGTLPIAANGHLVFDESHFNPTPGVPPSFGLSSLGESIYLFAPEGGGWRLVHEVEYRASANGVSFGLHTLSTGGLRHPAQTSLTLGLTNSGPRIGPVVINEIMYHPSFPAGTEFIEILNISAAPVPLFDPANPSNTWRINGASFQFPTNVTLGINQFLLVVDANPTQFRTNNGIPGAVQIFGPMGRLGDVGETLELQRPDSPQLDPTTGLTFAPYITVDEVSYRSTSPWPTETAGTGAVIARISPLAFGDDPINWAAATPTRGASNVVDSDADGIPDDVERRHGLNPNNNADARLDLDADGRTNLEEWRSGTALNDSSDLLRLDISRPAADRIQLAFPGKSGRRYMLQVNEQPGSAGWITVQEISPVRSGRVQVEQTPAATAARFYRLAVLPPL